ncbi:unnamed protein product, partial [Nesidiocoris tenuis]
MAQVRLQKRLRNLTFNGRGRLQDHLAEFDRISSELKSIGAGMENKEYVTQLLSSLPDDYHSVATSIEVLMSSKPDDVTPDSLKNLLLSEEERLVRMRGGEGPAVPESGNAFFGANRRRFQSPTRSQERKVRFGATPPPRPPTSYRGSSGGSRDGRSDQRPPEANFRGRCFKCSGRGHRRSQCPSRELSANAAENLEYEEEGHVFLASCSVHDGERDSDFDNAFSCSGRLHSNPCVGVNINNNTITWIVDSGSSHHLVKSEFRNFLIDSRQINRQINVAKEGESVKTVRVGNLSVYTSDGPGTVKCVYACNNLTHNLLSVRCLEDNGMKVVFADGMVTVSKNGKTLLKGFREGNTYRIRMELRALPQATLANNSSDLMHRRMGHSSVYPVRGICDICLRAKQTRRTFAKAIPADRKASRVLQWISSDVCGKFSPATFDGKLYYVSFIDHYTRFSVVYLITRKDEVESCFRKYVAMAEARFGKKVANLRCDGGGEYSSRTFKEYCEAKGIQIHYNISRNPENNGLAERLNRSCVEKARCMLYDSSLDKSMWGEAVKAAIYLLNRTPSSALPSGVTPSELWYGFKPDLSKIRLFGCEAYAHIPKEDRHGKFDERSQKAYMIGYCSNGWRLWVPARGKIINATSVVFNESGTPVRVVESESELDESQKSSVKESTSPVASPSRRNSSQDELESNEIRRSSRERRPPKHFEDYEMMLALSAGSLPSDVPRNYEEAVEMDDGWREAVDRELTSLVDNQTWELVVPPPGAHVIDSRWVFVNKEVNGRPVKKARLVARGYQQPRLEDEEDYAPVARLTTLRTLLAIAVERNMRFHQLDVKNAFIRSKLDCDVFMQLPKGLPQKEGM